MSIWLSSADGRRLQKATSIFLSPLNYDSGVAWRRAAGRGLEEVLKGSSSCFYLCAPGEPEWAGSREAEIALNAAQGRPNLQDRRVRAVLHRAASAPQVVDWTELNDVEAV